MSEPIIAGKKFNAKESAAYAEGAMKNQPIIKKPGGTVTLFAFDAGQGLAEHSTPHDALVQVLEGSVEISFGGEVEMLSEGEFIILPANVPHALKGTGRFRMLLTIIKS